MKTITIKKSELATYKGLGYSTKDIATKLDITTSEVIETMEHFGLIKSRKPAKQYTIEVIDDIKIQEKVSLVSA